MVSHLFRYFSFGACLLLMACTGATIHPVAMSSESPAAGEVIHTPIALKRLTTRLTEGQDIGGFVFGLMCAGPYANVTWPDEKEWPKKIPNARDNFQKAVRETGLTPVENIQENDPLSDNFTVVADIAEVRLNMCQKTDLFMNEEGLTAETSLTVSWEVFAPGNDKPLGQFLTSGYAKNDEPSAMGGRHALDEAFYMAAKNLALLADFRRALVTAEGHMTPSENAVECSMRWAKKGGPARHDSFVSVKGMGEAGGFFMDTRRVLVSLPRWPGSSDITLKVRGRKDLPAVLKDWDARLKVGWAEVQDSKFTAPSILKIHQTAPAPSTPVSVFADGGKTRVTGIVSAVRPTAAGDTPLIQADLPDADLTPGMPLLDSQDRVVGLYAPSSENDVQPGGDTLVSFVPMRKVLSSLHLCKGETHEQ